MKAFNILMITGLFISLSYHYHINNDSYKNQLRDLKKEHRELATNSIDLIKANRGLIIYMLPKRVKSRYYKCIEEYTGHAAYCYNHFITETKEFKDLLEKIKKDK